MECAGLQYAAQVPVLQAAGMGVVAFDYLGCGRSQKPNSFHAYAADELYQDLRAICSKYTKVTPFMHANKHACM